MDSHIHTPLTEEIAQTLKAGDYVYITGTIYTARDAAHKRMQEALDAGEPLLAGTGENKRKNERKTRHLT